MARDLNYDDHDAYQARFSAWGCRHCGSQGASFVGPAKGGHFAGIYCLHCGKWLDWLAWPPRSKAEEKRKRSKPLTILETDTCWFCGRDKATCALLGLRLERAHTIERARLIDAGLPSDDPLNLPVLCSECHAEQHRKREQIARYDKALGRISGG